MIAHRFSVHKVVVFRELKFAVMVSDIMMDVFLVMVIIMMFIWFYSMCNMSRCVMMILA